MYKACAAMMRRLQAEESMLTAERLRVGTGAASERSQKQIIRGWSEAFGGKARAAKRPPALLGSVGIGFRKQAKKANTATTPPTP